MTTCCHSNIQNAMCLSCREPIDLYLDGSYQQVASACWLHSYHDLKDCLVRNQKFYQQPFHHKCQDAGQKKGISMASSTIREPWINIQVQKMERRRNETNFSKLLGPFQSLLCWSVDSQGSVKLQVLPDSFLQHDPTHKRCRGQNLPTIS